jgi:hypothetical protein
MWDTQRTALRKPSGPWNKNSRKPSLPKLPAWSVNQTGTNSELLYYTKILNCEMNVVYISLALQLYRGGSVRIKQSVIWRFLTTETPPPPLDTRTQNHAIRPMLLMLMSFSLVFHYIKNVAEVNDIYIYIFFFSYVIYPCLCDEIFLRNVIKYLSFK